MQGALQFSFFYLYIEYQQLLMRKHNTVADNLFTLQSWNRGLFIAFSTYTLLTYPNKIHVMNHHVSFTALSYQKFLHRD